MRVHFVIVTGHVAIDDKVSFQDARSGMNVETGGRPHIIVTGDHSTASVMLGNGPEIVFIGANSALHVNYPRPSLIKSASKDLRYIVGKLWSKIYEDEWKPEEGNAVIGVRG